MTRTEMLSPSCRYIVALLLLISTLALGIPAASALEDTFPLRPFYPSVTTISSEELQEVYADALIVDVRTPFEFHVVRIAKGVNIPIASGPLDQALARYRSRNSSTPLIFYCNDSACSRAFRAALSAQAAGYDNVYVYDAGVFTWLGVDKERTILMGNSPARPRQVIPPQTFEKHQCNFIKFQYLAGQDGTVVVDIRNIYDRTRVPRVHGIKAIPMESFMEAVTNRVWAEKKLLIFDARGVQTRWLQFFLQANGYMDYMFLEGGMESLDVNAESVVPLMSSSEVTVSQNKLLEIMADESLSELDRRVFQLLIGSIRMENFAVVNREQATFLLGTSEKAMVASLAALRAKGYLLYNVDEDTLVAHLSPRLAWMGEMSGDLWRSRVREFDGRGGK